MKYPICKLCRIREASKKGSHIIPSFLVASMVNYDLSKKRDKEVSFRIDSLGTDFFVGRSVPPEKLEEVLNHSLTDENLKDNEHHYVRDYILCPHCEDRLAVLEGWASQIMISIEAQRKTVPINTNELIIENIDIKLLMMFFISITWRIALTNLSPLKFNSRDMEIFRSALDSILNLDITKASKNCIGKKIFNEFSYSIYTYRNYVGTNLIFSQNSNYKPWVMLLNEFVFVLRKTKRKDNLPTQRFFGLEKVITSTHSLDLNLSRIRVNIVSDAEWTKSILNIFQYNSYLFHSNIRNYFINSFVYLFGHYPSQETVEQFSIQVIFGEKGLSAIERYSFERTTLIMVEIFEQLIRKGKRFRWL